MNKKSKMLEDCNGNLSSKRVWGNRLLWQASVLTIGCIAGYYILDKKPTSEIVTLIIALLGAGTGCLGIGVLEKHKK